MNNNCVILIPALDPPEIFLSYIDELIQVGFKDILVVDDGSHQKKIFEKNRLSSAGNSSHPSRELRERTCTPHRSCLL